MTYETSRAALNSFQLGPESEVDASTMPINTSHIHKVVFGPVHENDAELLSLVMEEVRGPKLTPAPSQESAPPAKGYVPQSRAEALKSLHLAEDTVRQARQGTDTVFREAAERRLVVAKSELALYLAHTSQFIDK